MLDWGLLNLMVTSKLVKKCSLCAARLIMALVLDFGSVRIWICQDLDLSGFGSNKIRISQDSDLSGFGSLRIQISTYTWGNIHPRYSLIGYVMILEMDVSSVNGGD
jgi:hypothetical protein